MAVIDELALELVVAGGQGSGLKVVVLGGTGMQHRVRTVLALARGQQEEQMNCEPPRVRARLEGAARLEEETHVQAPDDAGGEDGLELI